MQGTPQVYLRELCEYWSDGYDWRRVPLEERKRKLASALETGDGVRY